MFDRMTGVHPIYPIYRIYICPHLLLIFCRVTANNDTTMTMAVKRVKAPSHRNDLIVDDLIVDQSISSTAS